MDTEIPVTIKSSHGSQSGTVLVQRLDKEERTKRGFKTLAIGYGVMIFSIILPLVHFILPPLLFILTPIAAFYFFKQKDVIIGGEGTCPGCKKPFTVARSGEIWPLEDVCGLCHEHVIIEKS